LKKLVRLLVNGKKYEVHIKPNKTLLETLREDLHLTGTKFVCGTGECGACTVLIDGKPVLSCLTLAVTVQDRDILTIEGLAGEGRLHKIQENFVKHGAISCGYCIPGMELMTKALLNENPSPTEEEIKEYLKGNLCRCSGYYKIIEAIRAAAEEMKKTDS
jgi:aerobic-type carbon monoxide dehydrogenase small subunit (CoxS/CutS family)